MAEDFPFGIDPRKPVPGEVTKVTVEVESLGMMNFDHPRESVAGMVAQIIVINTGRSFMDNRRNDFFTVTAWDQDKRHLKVKLNESLPR